MSTITLYAGTRGAAATVIAPLGTLLPGGGDNWFGGIFASDSKGVALSHGDTIQEWEVEEEEILSHRDLRHELLYGDAVDAALRPAVIAIFKRDLSADEAFDLAEFVVGDKSLFGDDVFVAGNETLISMLDAWDEGTADWRLQGLAGEVARRLGYAAVEMPDEHGTSYLVLSAA